MHRPSRRLMQGASSGILQCWETGEPYCLGNRLRLPAIGMIFNLRDRVERRTRGKEMERPTLGPMLREYIISEAMHALGIPSTRSLAVVTTGEKVARETFQPGAVLTRVAASHLRVGTFEYAANWGHPDDLRALADYSLQRHFGVPGKNPYQYLLESVIKRQAELIAKWQAAGFVHGVMKHR